MEKQRVLVIGLILLTCAVFQGSAVPRLNRQTATSSSKLNGRWRVKFTFASIEGNLIFDSKANGVGLFQLLDTELDNKPMRHPAPAVWSQLTNGRVSFSSEVELPLGTCCREIGTLTFKGRFDSTNAISGKLIFVTSVDEEESPYKVHSVVGTFNATRVSNSP